ncbi:MAG: VOC family protein [Gimesia chilikensis]
MSNNPVGWFEIYVQDIGRAKKFYETVLATELNPLPGGPEGELAMLAFPASPENPGSGGALVSFPDKDSAVNSTIVYFSCEDCAEEESRVEANGGSVERAKFSIGDYGFVSLVKDTDGNMIGLHSLK